MEMIQDLLKTKEEKCFYFRPNNHFYETVKINPKRWGQLYRGTKEPTITEAKSIAEFFEIKITEFL